MHHHDPDDLKHAPELATLLTLDAALRSSIAALEAAHAQPHVHAWRPAAPEPVRLAAAICASAAALARLLDEYESATVSRIVNEIPW
jgi:hypothetical protein